MKNTLIFTVFTCLLLGLTALAPNEPRGLQVGEKAPMFSAKDSKGREVSLQKLLKKGKVVLVFYRGYWCPFCNKQLAQLQDSLQLILQKGASVVAITPETDENIEKTVKKANASFPIVHDAQGNIMTSYKTGFTVDAETVKKYKGNGIDFSMVNGENGNTLPVPSVYVIDKQGIVMFAHVDPNFRKRVTVAEILKNL